MGHQLVPLNFVNVICSESSKEDISQVQASHLLSKIIQAHGQKDAKHDLSQKH